MSLRAAFSILLLFVKILLLFYKSMVWKIQKNWFQSNNGKKTFDVRESNVKNGACWNIGFIGNTTLGIFFFFEYQFLKESFLIYYSRARYEKNMKSIRNAKIFENLSNLLRNQSSSPLGQLNSFTLSHNSFQFNPFSSHFFTRAW